MSDYEKILFESIDEDGVHFEVEDNPLMVEFEENLRTYDIVLMFKEVAKHLFEKRSMMEQFVRERGFTTKFDPEQYMFVFEKEMPWGETRERDSDD